MARGYLGRSSDIDLVVVVSRRFHRRRTQQSIYRALVGVESPIDVLVIRPDDIEKYGQDPSGFLAGLLKGGSVLCEHA
jgi:predicted nucleotidyltransferase